MSSESEENEDSGLSTPYKTPRNTFKAPSNDRPKPIFLGEPKSFSTKKVSRQSSGASRKRTFGC